jgi:predicted nuclease of predicted toxin-antitoxin system
MRVILDENLPHQLRAHLANHETATTVYMGWGGFQNGAALNAAEGSGFDVLVTGDLSLQRQQNLMGQKLAIVSLSAHNWRIIKSHVAKIAAAVDTARPGSFVRVECGTFSRRHAKPKDHRSDDGSLSCSIVCVTVKIPCGRVFVDGKALTTVRR